MKKGNSSKEPKSILMKWVHQNICLVLTLIVAVGTLSQSQFSAKAEEYNLTVTVSGAKGVVILDQENAQEVTSSDQKQIVRRQESADSAAQTDQGQESSVPASAND